MKLITKTALLIAGPMLAARSQADLIATEYFNGYGTSEIVSDSTSPLNGGTGWITSWSNADKRFLPGTSLSYTATGYDGTANTNGVSDGALAYAGNLPGASGSIMLRDFSTTASTVWFSALISIDEVADRAILWIDSNSSDGTGDDFIGVLDGNIHMRYANGNLSSAGPATVGTHLLLAKAEIDVSGSNDRLTYWFDPDLSGGEAGLGQATYSDESSDTFGTSIDGVGILLRDDDPAIVNGGELIDSIRVGTNFVDVVTPAPPLPPLPPAPPIHVSEGFPNILILLADDIGYEALGAYGGLDFNTPNLDAMAEQGVKFTRAYTSPACTPSRVSLHTSRYPTTHGQTATLPVHLGTTDTVNFQAMPTFAQQLQKRGYQTSTTGKWQLATLTHHPNHIANAGFDSWCVWQIWDGSAKTTRYWNPYLNRDGDVLDNISGRFGPDVLEEYVWARMTTARDADTPFLIVHNMLLPHDPITDTPSDRELGRAASLGNMIEYLDRLVGRTLDKVEDLGIRENTYVFFIGDNGTEADYFNPRHTRSGNVTGGKRDLTDAGTHVPLLVWGPAGLKSGREVSDLIDITDIFPTVCQLARTEIPETIPYRGTSFVPQLHGRRGISRTSVHQAFRNDSAVSDGKWRLDDSGVLRDSRNLPAEPVAAPGTESDTRTRLQELLDDAPEDPSCSLECWRTLHFGDDTLRPRHRPRNPIQHLDQKGGSELRSPGGRDFLASRGNGQDAAVEEKRGLRSW